LGGQVAGNWDCGELARGATGSATAIKEGPSERGSGRRTMTRKRWGRAARRGWAGVVVARAEVAGDDGRKGGMAEVGGAADGGGGACV
jgi:hypothetical protein